MCLKYKSLRILYNVHMHVTELPYLGFLTEEGVRIHKRPNGELVGVFQCALAEEKHSGHQVFDGLGIRVSLKVYNEKFK